MSFFKRLLDRIRPVAPEKKLSQDPDGERRKVTTGGTDAARSLGKQGKPDPDRPL